MINKTTIIEYGFSVEDFKEFVKMMNEKYPEAKIYCLTDNLE